MNSYSPKILLLVYNKYLLRARTFVEKCSPGAYFARFILKIKYKNNACMYIEDKSWSCLYSGYGYGKMTGNYLCGRLSS